MTTSVPSSTSMRSESSILQLRTTPLMAFTDSMIYLSAHILRGGFLFVYQMILVRVHQRLPTGVDDVGAHADRPEVFGRFVAAFTPRFDHHPDGGGGVVVAVDDADL